MHTQNPDILNTSSTLTRHTDQTARGESRVSSAGPRIPKPATGFLVFFTTDDPLARMYCMQCHLPSHKARHGYSDNSEYEVLYCVACQKDVRRPSKKTSWKTRNARCREDILGRRCVGSAPAAPRPWYVARAAVQGRSFPRPKEDGGWSPTTEFPATLQMRHRGSVVIV